LQLLHNSSEFANDYENQVRQQTAVGTKVMRREYETGMGSAPLGSLPFQSSRVNTAASKPAARAPELSGARQLTVYTISLGLWVSGALWLLLHHFVVIEGPFGPIPHPMEFFSIAAHGAFGFASLWMLGLLWSVHIPAGWRTLRRRWSGSVMFGVSASLIVSGYLLYYLSAEMIPIVAVLHWGIGLFCPALFLLHRFAKDRSR
jgi:hypothetical protein